VLLLLDRDGTLMPDVGYPNDPSLVSLMPGSAQAVRQLATVGYVPAVVSNQSGLARGRIMPAQAEAVHQEFVRQFQAESGLVLPCFYCPHGPDDGCACRKPKTGLLQQAARELGLVGHRSVMIGDKPSDVAAGQAWGAETVLLWHGHGNPASVPAASIVATDWPMIVRWLTMRGVQRDAG
jgi:histidinol-phosphate phosphatase family protein